MTNSNVLFKRLSPEDVTRYMAEARWKYTPGTAVDPLWHPVYRRECEQMNVEAVQHEFCPDQWHQVGNPGSQQWCPSCGKEVA